MSPRPSTSAAFPSGTSRASLAAPSDAILIATFLNPTDAELFCSRLESAGIQPFVRDAAVNAMVPLSHALGGVKVLVAPHDEAAALGIAAQQGGALSADQEPPGDSGDAAEAGASTDGENDLERPSEVDAMAMRAWRASVMGFMLPLVLHLYSIRLLIHFAFMPGRAARGSRWRAGAAVLLNALGLIMVLGFLRRR
jgi:hypothetical protein